MKYLFGKCRVSLLVLSLILLSIAVRPILAQPGDDRSYPAFQRAQLTENLKNELNVISDQIKNNNSNTERYEKRIDIYRALLDLNFDNQSWFVYADQYGNELSTLVKLKDDSESYYRKGGWLAARFFFDKRDCPCPDPNKLSELYPHNRYMDGAIADYLTAIRLTTDPKMLQAIYTGLSGLYSGRPDKLVKAPNFPKWKKRIPLQLIDQDFENSIKYILLALQEGVKVYPSETFKKNIVSLYLLNAKTSAKLGNMDNAEKYTQEAQKYR